MSRKEIVQITTAVILSMFAAFSFISLISYNRYDPPFGDYHSSDLAFGKLRNTHQQFDTSSELLKMEDRVNNLCGSIGAYLSYGLITVLGKTSYLLVFLLGGWGISLFTQKGLQQIWIRIIGGIFFIPASAILAICLWSPNGTSSGMSSSGGVLGLIGYSALTDHFGSVGTFLLLITVTPLSLLLATNMAPYVLIVNGYNKSVNFLSWIRSHYTTFPLFRLRQTINHQKSNIGTLPNRSTQSNKSQITRESALAEQKEAEPQNTDVTGIQQILHLRELERKQDGTDEALPNSPQLDTVTIPGEESANWTPVEVSKENRLNAGNGLIPTSEKSETSDVKWAAPGIEPKAKKLGGKPSKRSVRRDKSSQYNLPSIDILDEPVFVDFTKQERIIAENARILETTLAEFNVDVKVVETKRGPVVTQYELDLAPGIKVGKIVSLSEDIARAMKAQSVRVVAPIPGKSTVGVEIPNVLREFVRLRELLAADILGREKLTIPLFLGKDITGLPVVSDLALMPHLLIAGATGSGKSVCINTIILSILLTQKPEDVKLLLVDPKMVELSLFKDIPHLMSPVVTDMKKAAAVLEWAVNKMDERYEILARANVRNLASYNQLGEKEIRKRLAVEENVEIDDVPFHMPHIVIIVDELADLMMVASKEVESYITRLSQKSRAVGIHIILATQRPSVDVITGLIKSNLPARISFQVASKFDSRTILDRIGAEKLLGSGDMLFLPPGTSKLIRSQGTYVSDREVVRIVEYLKSQAKPEYSEDLVQYKGVADINVKERDELYDEAVRIVIQTQRGSVSLLQNRLKVGYSRAARLIDYMAEDGIVGDYKGSQAREVLISLEEWEQRVKDS